MLELVDEPGTERELKSIVRTIEPYSALLPDQLKLADWMCKAYHCTTADALRVMIPAALRGSKVKEKKCALCTLRTILILKQCALQC